MHANLLGELELVDCKYERGEMNNKSILRHDPKDDLAKYAMDLQSMFVASANKFWGLS